MLEARQGEGRGESLRSRAADAFGQRDGVVTGDWRDIAKNNLQCPVDREQRASLAALDCDLGLLDSGKLRVILSSDPVRMREELESVPPCDGDQRDAGRLGSAERERRRGGDGDQDFRAQHRRFLHHLHRHAAGEEEHATRPALPAPRQRADQLVQRVVAADVFTQRDEARAIYISGAPQRRAVHRAGAGMKILLGRQRGDRGGDVLRGEPQSVTDEERRAHCLRQAVDAAEPAAGRAGKMPSPLRQRVGARGGEPHLHVDAVLGRNDGEALDLGRRRDDALGEAEADGEILKVLRRRHHHGVRAAAVGQRHAGLFGDGTKAVGFSAVAESRAADRL